MGLPWAAPSWPNLTVFRQGCLAHGLIADAHAPGDLHQCHRARVERRRTGAPLDIQTSTRPRPGARLTRSRPLNSPIYQTE